MTSNIPCPVCKAIVPRPAMDNDGLLHCPKCQHHFRAASAGVVIEEPEIPVLEAVEPIPEVIPVLPALTVQPTPPRASSATPPSDVLWWRGNCIDGLNSQPCIIVLRRKFVVFLPTEKSKNLLRVMAGGLAEAASPIQTISLDWLRRRPDLLQAVKDLWAERPDEFDKCVIQLAEHLGGWAMSPIDVSVARTGKWGRSEGIVFTHGPTELRGNAPLGPVLDRLLEGWKETDEPILGAALAMFVLSLLPLGMAAVSFIAHLFTDDIPWWAGLIWVGAAGLLYVAVGIKAGLVWLRRKRKPAAGSQENRTASEERT